MTAGVRGGARPIEVSVVVPTYQGAAYLAACLDSIAEQDLDGVEVLLADDGSTDATLDIAHAYADRIEHLRVERNRRRLGAVANVNSCVDRARGRWIKPVFQDDVILPGCLAAMLDARRDGVPVVVCGRTYLFEGEVPPWQLIACQDLLDESLPRQLGSGVATGDQVAEAIVQTLADRRPHLNVVGEPVAQLFDRDAVRRAGGFDTAYAQLWDYELILRLGVQAGIALVDEPLAGFRVHGESQTARNLAGTAFGINVLDRQRLLVSYATAPAYAPVREAAARRNPPLDPTAMALGSTWAARRVVEELPVEDQRPARRAVARVAKPLPTLFPEPWSGSRAATGYAVHLLHELSVDVEDAVTRVYRAEPLAIDLTLPPEAEPVAGDDPHGTARARRGPLARVGKAARALRTNQWWNHMLGPIVAMAYLQIGWREVPLGEALGRLAALLASAVALAVFAYVVNDAADRKADRLAGKRNSMARVRRRHRIALMVGLAALGALPWAIIPLEPPALAVLVGLYALPLLYSPRPVRLKEHPVLGPLADASNAFVLPALFTIALYAPLGPAAGPPALMVVGAVCWAAGFGLRAILAHQVDDAENDRRTGTRTLVTEVGVQPVRRVVRRVLFPVELLGIALLTATVATWAWWLPAVALTLVAAFHGARLAGLVPRDVGTTTLEKGWFLYWTQIWPAFLVSLALAVQDPVNLVLVGVVLVMFGPRLGSGLRSFRDAAAREAARNRRRLRRRLAARG